MSSAASARDREALRASFSHYVEALTQTYDAITHVSRDERRPIGERAEAMRTVIGQHGVYARQHQLELTAPRHVVQLALAAANELARYRDVVASGVTRGTPECTAARRNYREARFALIDAMRASLERR